MAKLVLDSVREMSFYFDVVTYVLGAHCSFCLFSILLLLFLYDFWQISLGWSATYQDRSVETAARRDTTIPLRTYARPVLRNVWCATAAATASTAPPPTTPKTGRASNSSAEGVSSRVLFLLQWTATKCASASPKHLGFS